MNDWDPKQYYKPIKSYCPECRAPLDEKGESAFPCNYGDSVCNHCGSEYSAWQEIFETDLLELLDKADYLIRILQAILAEGDIQKAIANWQERYKQLHP